MSGAAADIFCDSVNNNVRLNIYIYIYLDSSVRAVANNEAALVWIDLELIVFFMAMSYLDNAKLVKFFYFVNIQ